MIPLYRDQKYVTGNTPISSEIVSLVMPISAVFYLVGTSYVEKIYFMLRGPISQQISFYKNVIVRIFLIFVILFLGPTNKKKKKIEKSTIVPFRVFHRKLSKINPIL